MPIINPQIISYSLHSNLYLNITNRCTLRCRFCPKFNHQWDVQNYSLRLQHEPSSQEIINAIDDPSAYNEVVFCGLGEPTQRLETLLIVAEYLKAHNVKIRLNTDGLGNYLAKRDITKQLGQWIDEISISVNAQNHSLYDQHCRPKVSGAYHEVLDFICCSRRHIAAVTISAIDGLQGVDIQACKDIARSYGVVFKRRELGKVG